MANRIIVKEVNWIGDLVMSLPALRSIRAAFPSSHIAVLVRDEITGFFDGLKWIDEVIPYRSARGLQKLARNYSVIRAIRARRFDSAILFPNSFESALWMWLARVPTRVGYATDGRGLMLTHRAYPPADALNAHQSHYWLAMVRETLGLDCTDNALSAPLEVDERHRERMRSWLDQRRQRPKGPIIAIAPAAAYGPAKEWPSEHYAALIDRLNRDLDAECVIIGTAGELAKCEGVATRASSHPIIAAGEIGLGETIALLSLCDGFVGNDSGAMHLAAALGIPTIGIFGSTNPARTSPLGRRTAVVQHPISCSPCLARTCRYGHYDCLRSITSEAVAQRLEALLEGNANLLP